MRGTYVHDRNAGTVHLVYDPLGRNTDSAHEQLRLLLNDHINELGELTLCVIVLKLYEDVVD